MNHFFRAGALIWVSRVVFFAVLYMLDLAGLDAFLLIAAFLTVDLTLCLRLSRLTRATELMASWRSVAYEEQPEAPRESAAERV